jgi:transposase
MAKPAHIPTKETFAKVRATAILGTSPEDIADLLGISLAVWRKHYAKEFKAARVQQGDQVIKANIYGQAARGRGRDAIAAAKAWGKLVNSEQPAGMISPARFAAQIGVTRQSVHRAIDYGRVPTYAADGTPLRPGERGRPRFVKLEGRTAWSASRERVQIVDHESFMAHRVAKEALHADLLRARLARERGGLVSRRAVNEALAKVGSTLPKRSDTRRVALTKCACHSGQLFRSWKRRAPITKITITAGHEFRFFELNSAGRPLRPFFAAHDCPNLGLAQTAAPAESLCDRFHKNP